MAETHLVRLVWDGPREVKNGEVVELEDPTPLRSAQLFKFISDKVWQSRPAGRGYIFTSYSSPSVLDPAQALSVANEAAGSIDESLVIAGTERNLTLRGSRGEDVTIESGQKATPESASMETFNWDDGFTTRSFIEGSDGEGRRTVFRFSDGHVDYARELSVNFHFPIGEHSRLVLGYSAQRYQYKQDLPTTVSSTVWFSDFAETGYEGNSLHRAEMTEEQELIMLRALAQIGGVSLDDTTF